MLPELRLERGRGLQQRLYEGLRAAILAGRLPPGTRLPSSRALADEYGIARQTIVLAYQRLLDEGYAAGRVGAGTYVSETLSLQPAAQPHVPASAAPSVVPLATSAWAGRARSIVDSLAEPPLPTSPTYDFRPGVPDWDAFPHVRWRRLLARRWRQAPSEPALGQYGDPAGYRPLRDVLAAYLSRSRGLRCTADDVIIVTGSQQALDLLARVRLNPGDDAAIEEPGYASARAIFVAAGARLAPVPVDESGLRVDALEDLPANTDARRPKAPKLLYVTPSHQYPLGVTLALARRLRLLEWASRSGAVVVEDDYDSELRYAGAPLPALQGLDERGCVAYVGSCSSVLFPPLRVGWIVAPPALRAPLIAAKWLADRQTSTLDQQVLADFIAGGDFARHLRRSRALYGARREALVEAARRHLPIACRLTGDAAGLHTPLLLPPGVDEQAVVRAAAGRGVGVEPLGHSYANPSAAPPGLLLGFAPMDESAIDRGLRRLGAALRDALR